MQREHRQGGFRVRMDWGLNGATATAIAAGAGVAVVVDVLSFTTTVSVAVDAGMTVMPYRWADPGADAYARTHAAVLAVGRSQARAGQVSLSPQSIRAARGVSRLVLPSPNGATIAAYLSETGGPVVAASLRNADAVADWISRRHGVNAAVAVVAAGEHWPDGGLRPAVEDLWGAGAVISALRTLGWSCFSPEASTAGDSYDNVRPHLQARLRACASGAELIALGFSADVDIAAELNTSHAVPCLGNTGFQHTA